MRPEIQYETKERLIETAQEVDAIDSDGVAVETALSELLDWVEQNKDSGAKVSLGKSPLSNEETDNSDPWGGV